MKYCKKCHKEIDTEETQCPVCNEELEEMLSEEDAAEIVATTTLL
ncbi:RNA polymerase subunit RPABC4/transcription elongation factor Spt4 [Lachnospiraceae bacterium PF1-22]